MNEVIKIRNVSKAFGDNEVLKDISLSLREGENIVVMGRSGIGKSVLIKCIIGLLSHDSGTIEIFGTDTSTLSYRELDDVRKKMGFLFQGGALYDSMSVRENLEFPLLRSRFLKETVKEKNKIIDEVLENVGLLEEKNKMPSELSGGMQKRLGLARTLVLRPKIILYDEPTTGLDPVTSNEISKLMISVQEKYNTSSIIVTHDLKCAKMTANDIKLLKDGDFYAEGTYEEMQKSNIREVAEYFN